MATNEFNKVRLSKEDMLFEYKQQSKTECGFRFIKNNAFHVSSIFLKNSGRIEALMMYMTLSLMVYSLGQMMLRQALQESQEMVLDQLGKPTRTPTLIWICRQFHGVQVLKISFGTHSQELVSNLNDLTKRIIGYFGEEAEKIYGLAEA